MRYLSEHHETRRSLQAWAGDRQVAIAGFYFWVSGSEDQRSRVGLLRSLLHQLLSLYPESIPATFPRLWQKLSGMTTKERIAMGLEWTGPELTSGFLRLLDTGLSQAKVCFFVDGLDELDGDHDSMIRFFRDLGSGNQVKMCLSSRPWQVFERAFARSVPNLRLQELILGDMTNYAYDSLYVEAFSCVIPRWLLWNSLLNSLLLTFVLSHHCLADGRISTSAELSGRTLTTPRISCGRLSHPPMACSCGLDWWSGRLSRSSAALKQQL